MKHYFILFYTTVADYLLKREVYRKDHLTLIHIAYKNGGLIMAGALAEPADGALLVFKEKSDAIAFAENDPYVKNGLISKWHVQPWVVVSNNK